MKPVIKKQLLALSAFLVTSAAIAQTGIGTLTPHSSAMLDVSSTSKGLLPPRLTAVQRSGIATPAAGLVVYDTDSAALMLFNGTAWAKVGSGGAGNGWGLNGNAGNPAGSYIGTSDNQPLNFRVNNLPAGFIDPQGTSTALGNGTLKNLTVPLSANTAVGSGALFANTTGAYNTALGEGALVGNTTGSNNIAIGTSALGTVITGTRNIAIGNNAMLHAESAANVGIGDHALEFATASHNTALGTDALRQNTTAADNTAVGHSALRFNNTGAGNTAVGNAALYSNTQVGNLTAVGDSSLSKNGTGAQANSNEATNNTALGAKTLQNNTTGWNNTATGFGALRNNVTGAYNVANGVYSLVNNNADGNTAIGTYSMNFNTTGSYNTAVGVNAQVHNETGMRNASFGHDALANNTSGNYNTAIGDNGMLANTTGSKNTTLGYNANLGSANLTNATAIGAEAVVNTSNSIVLGSNANVGIGTSSPSAKLDVAGNVKIADGTQGAGKVLTSDANGVASWQTPASGGGGSSQWVSNGNDITYTQGQVGVSNPGTGPALVASLTSGSGANIGAIWGVTSFANTYGVHGQDYDFFNSTGTGVYGNSQNGTGVKGMSFYGAGGIFEGVFSGKALITGSGNVGIGVPTPLAKLDVAGNMRLVDGTQGAGKVLTSDANGFATWQTPSSGSGGSSTTWVQNGINNSNIYNANFYNNTVTIGSNNPSQVFKMTVNGGAQPSGAYITAASNSDMALVTGAGKVGFGTSNSLVERVEVNGGIRIADATPSAADGTLRYTPATGFEGRHGSNWVSLGGNFLAGPGIAFTGGGTTISAKDTSVTNEIQLITLTGNTLELSNGGGSVTLPTTSGSAGYAFKATTSTGTSVGIPAGTTQILLYAEDFDPQNGFDLPNSQFVAPVAGIYQFSAAAQVSPSGTGDIVGGVSFKVNNNSFSGSAKNVQIHLAAPFNFTLENTVTVQLAAGDVVKAYVAVGGITPSLTFQYDGTGNTHFSGFRIQ